MIWAVGSACCLPSQAQELQSRLAMWRWNKALHKAVDAQRVPVSSRYRLRPLWTALAQLQPPSTSTTDSRSTTISPNADTTVAVPLRGRRQISTYTDFSLGFDGETAVVADPVPREIRIRRSIRVLNLAVDYPLGARTSLAVGLPLISQTTHVRDAAGPYTQRGNGLGDISLLVERRSAESKRGVEAAASLGLVLPTGRDPFGLGPLQLPTGNGFFQPYGRVSVRKLRVPLQLYAALSVGKAIPRTINGQRLSLPTTFGGEAGFTYSMGPELTASTSVSANRLSSPFLLDTGVDVAYLTEAINYNPGGETSMRASVDVGLTDDSTDAYFGLSLRHGF